MMENTRFEVKKSHFVIESTVNETHDIKSFYLKPKDNTNIFDYRPGHFLNCTIIGKEDIGKRSFSIASSPTEKGFFITVKLAGTFTHALFDMKENDAMEILGPLGLPYLRDENDNSDIVMISGGSGIVPFRSLIKYMIDKKINNKLFLFNCNKTIEDICYREELSSFCSLRDNLLMTNFVEDVERSQMFIKGRIKEEYVKRYLKEPEKKIYYICGPKGLITASIEILTRMNVPMGRIKVESWG